MQQAVQEVWGALMGAWWWVRGGRVLRDETEALYEGDHIQVYSFVYDVDDEMGASRGREKHPCFYNAFGGF